MTGGGGGVIIIRFLRQPDVKSRLTHKECEDVDAIEQRTNGGVCNPKDAGRLGRILERIAKSV